MVDIPGFMVIRIDAHLVDGGLLPLDKATGKKLVELCLKGRASREYFTSRQMIEGVVTDDWGPPPTALKIYIRLQDDRRKELWIPYSDQAIEELEKEVQEILR